MKRTKDNKGFTLVEMLVVIAIIAVLVAIIIPTITSASTRSKAAADAANLRTVLGEANNATLQGQGIQSVIDANIEAPPSKSFPGASLKLLFEYPGFISIFYVDGDNYYGLEYFSEVSEKGSSEISTAAPTGDGEWYTFGE